MLSNVLLTQEYFFSLVHGEQNFLVQITVIESTTGCHSQSKVTMCLT